MKTFTYPHKNWVLTAALLAVLGINVSFNSHSADGIATADFASTVQEGVVQGKIYTSKGVVPVKFIDNGENQVLAVFPKKMTEGKVCDTCGFESVALNVKNKTDVDALTVELMNRIEQQKSAEAAKPAEVKVAETKPAKKEVEPTSDEPVEKPSLLEPIKAACEKKKSDSAVLSCQVDRFVKTLKSRKADIEKDEAMDYYKENIESLISNQLTESRRIINRARRAAALPGQWYSFQESDDSQESAGEMRDAALTTIRTLIKGIPGKYEDIRKRLIVAETEMAKAEARELQQTFVQSKNTKDPGMGIYLMQEGQLRVTDFDGLLRDMMSNTQMGLEGISSSEVSTSLKNQYMDYLNEFTQTMYKGINGNIYNFMGTDNGNSTLPGLRLDPRLTNPGRGGGTLGTSTRTGNSLSSSLDQRLQLNTQQPIGAQLSIPTENNGVSFGTMSPATAESLRQRALIQNQFPH